MTRTKLGFVGIALCLAFLVFQKWALGPDYQAPWYVWVPMLFVLGWSLWQLKEPPDPNSKAFDFNPKRGVTYFFLGFVIFPIMLGIDAVFGTGMTIGGAALITLGGSILIGVLGVFTEHVGV